MRRAPADLVERLRAAGVPSPEVDVRELVEHAEATGEDLMALVDRRAAREPLQHITGKAYFRYETLEVGPGVFVPRPETEVLAQWAIDQAREVGAGAIVVDLCTGSGAIARSVAREVAQARVYAVELGDQAVEYAARNLAGTGVELVHGDMADAFGELDGSVDVVVANPPYIPLEAFESVAAEARDFDPGLALWSGQDGLDAMRVVEGVAARLLKPGGVVGAEHADVQGESAPAVFAAAGRWSQVRDHLDLAGRPRFTTARLAR